MNLTELRLIYHDRFHTRISAGVPRASLIDALERGEMIDAPDPVEAMREKLVILLGQYWSRIQSQIPCHGVCFTCPDGQVIDCYKDNHQLMSGGNNMERTTLDPSATDLTIEKILADEAATKDRIFLLKLCVNNDWLQWESAMDLSDEKLLDVVKENIGGKSEDKPKDKKKDKAKAAKDKAKAKAKKEKEKEPTFTKPEESDDYDQNESKSGLTSSIPEDLLKDIERGRDLVKKKALKYLDKIDTMVKDVAELKLQVELIGSMVQKVKNLLEDDED